jgi:hypothetical protein
MHELKHRDRSGVKAVIQNGKGKTIFQKMKSWFDEL